MKRRSFLTRAMRVSAAGLLTSVPSFAARAGSGLNGERAALLNGKVLVLIHLKGGNDGLNTVIPYTDPAYTVLRPNIAVPQVQVLPIGADTGLHPDLEALWDLYNDDKVAVLQGVGYPDMNLSHFRATDIWHSGSARDVYLETGWLARFVEGMDLGFPEIPTDQPYGIQQSFNHQIPFQGERGPIGVVVDNPESFYSLVLGSYSGDWNDELPETRGGEELDFVRRLDRETFAYAEAIQTAAEGGENTVEYPNSSLGRQLEVIARLVSGELGTPIYVGSRGGFDTHSNQPERHSEIFSDLAYSISAFMADLENQGLEEEVLLLTISEFGRRPEENGSWGTDHGTAAPVLAVGAGVNAGVYGENPSLVDLDENSNLLVQQDYRGVFSHVLQNHFDAPVDVVDAVFSEHFDAPNFLQPSSRPASRKPIRVAQPQLLDPYPNPVSASSFSQIPIRFDLAQSAPVAIEVFDIQGRRVQRLAGSTMMAKGRHQLGWKLDRVPAGTYLIQMRTPDWQENRKVVVVP